jgi:hypothetical protein
VGASGVGLTVPSCQLLLVRQLRTAVLHAGRNSITTLREWLNRYFTGPWIGRGGPTEWPPCDLFLWVWTKHEICRSKPRTPDDLNNKFEMVYCCLPWLVNERCWACVFQVAEVCAECCGLCCNLTLNCSAWALKWCKICSNTASRLGGTAIKSYEFTWRGTMRGVRNIPYRVVLQFIWPALHSTCS